MILMWGSGVKALVLSNASRFSERALLFVRYSWQEQRAYEDEYGAYRNTRTKICPSTAFSTTNPTLPGLGFFLNSLELFVLHPYLFLRLDCPVFCRFYLQHTTQTPMPVTGFEPVTPASDRPQTLALVCSNPDFHGERPVITRPRHSAASGG